VLFFYTSELLLSRVPYLESLRLKRFYSESAAIMISKSLYVGVIVLLNHLLPLSAFSVCTLGVNKTPFTSTTSLSGYTQGRSSPRTGSDRSKRQERVGHLVRIELASILHSGQIKGDFEYLDDVLRQRISLVSVDVAPDLRQARISVSIRNSMDATSNQAVDKRRAFAWLVRNTKPLRHSLAQRMSHMKSCPDLNFAQVDVAAAVDVMYLIEKVSAGYKRESVGSYGENDNAMPEGYFSDMDFDEELDEEEWEEEDDEFFDT
jgi:ribosome-binding factor A